MKSMMMGLALAGLVATAQAAEIYQWKDEQGRVHFGEVVPEKYKKSAQQKETNDKNFVPMEKVNPARLPSGAPESDADAAPEDEAEPPFGGR